MLKVNTSFHPLAGSRVLALADADNLAISFRRIHGLELDQAALRFRLAKPALKLTATAVLTTHPRMTYTRDAWGSAGWRVTAIERETALTWRGPELHANADFDIMFEAGVLTSNHPHADCLVLLTGDGNLAAALARDVRRRRPDMGIIAAAVPGAASARLRDAALFDAFIPLGLDVTKGVQALCA